MRDRRLRLDADAAVIACSPVSVAEIRHGVRQRERGAIERLLDALTSFSIDAKIGRRAGIFLKRHYAACGLGIAHALIGATAATHELLLWTRNRKHHPMREVRFY